MDSSGDNGDGGFEKGGTDGVFVDGNERGVISE